MLTLIINDAEYCLQYEILRDEKLIRFFECDSRKLSAEFLPRQLSEDCVKLGIQHRDFDRIAAVNGPGNFMGLRITSSFCSALARCGNSEQAGLDYMECLAYNCSSPDKVIHVLTKATRNAVHYAVFQCDPHGIPMRLRQTQLVSSKEELQLVSLDDIFIGSGCGQLGVDGQPAENPLPASLQQACEKARWGHADIVPVYVKLCDALQNFDAISEKQGLIPSESRSVLEETMQAKNIVRQ